jgi:hypothetical protein
MQHIDMMMVIFVCMHRRQIMPQLPVFWCDTAHKYRCLLTYVMKKLQVCYTVSAVWNDDTVVLSVLVA